MRWTQHGQTDETQTTKPKNLSTLLTRNVWTTSWLLNFDNSQSEFGCFKLDLVCNEEIGSLFPYQLEHVFIWSLKSVLGVSNLNCFKSRWCLNLTQWNVFILSSCGHPCLRVRVGGSRWTYHGQFLSQPKLCPALNCPGVRSKQSSW